MNCFFVFFCLTPVCKSYCTCTSNGNECKLVSMLDEDVAISVFCTVIQVHFNNWEIIFSSCSISTGICIAANEKTPPPKKRENPTINETDTMLIPANTIFTCWYSTYTKKRRCCKNFWFDHAHQNISRLRYLPQFTCEFFFHLICCIESDKVLRFIFPKWVHIWREQEEKSGNKFV